MSDSTDPEAPTDIIDAANEARVEGNERARDALAVFLDREGNLTLREDAIDTVAEEIDAERDMATRAVNSLVGDIVDPVQQVPHPDGRFVGVIEYHEYPDAGAYGYVEYSDRYGERKRVVCVRCVEQHDHDENVAHATEGEGTAPDDADWSDLLDRITSHYADSHDVAPDAIEPGASLVSGTTMGGNDAWHDGNVSAGSNIQISSQTIDVGPQGSGSGLDADYVDGYEATQLGGVSSWTVYREHGATLTTAGKFNVKGLSYVQSWSKLQITAVNPGFDSVSFTGYSGGGGNAATTTGTTWTTSWTITTTPFKLWEASNTDTGDKLITLTFTLKFSLT